MKRRAPLLAALLVNGQAGCFLAVSFDDPGGDGGGAAGGAVAGGAGVGAGGAPENFTRYPLGELGWAVSVEGGRGAVVSGDPADSVRLFTTAAPTQTLAAPALVLPAAVLSRPDGALVARADPAAGEPSLARCDASGCADWVAQKQTGTSYASLAAIGGDVAALRRADGVLTLIGPDGDTALTLGVPGSGGAAVAARELADASWGLGWIALDSAGGGAVWRARRTTNGGFSMPETLAVAAVVGGLALGADGAVFYAALTGADGHLMRWKEGDVLDLQIPTRAPGLVVVDGGALWTTVASGGRLGVARCTIADAACTAIAVSCDRIGGLARDALGQRTVFSCDDALIVW